MRRNSSPHLILLDIIKLSTGLVFEDFASVFGDVIEHQVPLLEVATRFQKRHTSVVAYLTKCQVFAKPFTEIDGGKMGGVENQACVTVDTCEYDGDKDQVHTVVRKFAELVMLVLLVN